MARLSRCREELTLSGRVLLASLLVLGLTSPDGSSAQESPDVRGLAEAGLAVTRLHGETALLMGFGVGLALSPSFTVGGAGYVLPSAVEIGRVALQDLEMSFGYGGIFGEYRRPSRSGSGIWFGRLLVGAGNSDLNDVPTSLRLDSDNFVVVEPTVGFHLGLPYRFGASVELSYRLVGGVEDLRGVEASDLRSLSLGVHVRFSPL